MLDNYIKNFIKNHAIESIPYECCGFVIKTKEGLDCIKSKNFSKLDNCFEISPIEYLNIKNNYSINYIYHSHPNTINEDFSEADLKMSNNLLINLILYIIDIDIFKIYDFRKDKTIYG